MKVLRAIGAIAALAGTGAALGEPLTLSDAQLAEVAAGYYETSPSRAGAVIAGDAAAVDLHTVSGVQLSSGSQSGAKAVNVVNAAGSGIANGNNLWRSGDAGIAASAVSFDQSNRIVQEGPAGAYVGDWQVQGVNRATLQTGASTSEFSGGIIPTVFTFTGTIVDSTTTNPGKKDENTDTTTSHPTESLRIGEGVAMAGEVDLEVSGAGVAFSTHNTADLTGTATTSVLWGLIKSTTTTHVTRDETNSGEVDLAPFSVHAKGVVCAVIVGSCEPYAGRFSSTSQSSEIVLQPARVRGASAGRIVLSYGALDQSTESHVALEGNAQRNLMGLNAVNAASSAVGNAVNAAQGALPSPGAMIQANSILQFR
jgi:hypothetical protein